MIDIQGRWSRQDLDQKHEPCNVFERGLLAEWTSMQARSQRQLCRTQERDVSCSYAVTFLLAYRTMPDCNGFTDALRSFK